MKTRYFYFIAAAVLMAGCAKEVQDIDVINEAKTVLTVGLSDSRTHMGDREGNTRHIYWSNGDQIAVNGIASEALAELPEGTTSTTFTFDGVLSTPYNVLYPASIYEDATHVTLPAVQTYKSGGFAEGMNPMAGYSADGSNISLGHLCAVLKISIKRAATAADEDNIIAVRFQGRNAEKVSGTFAIDYQNASLTEASELGSEVRVVKSQATSTTTAVDYYLVVPARTYANGFDVIVQDVSGHIMTKSKLTSKELEAGHLYNMPEFEFVPTGTELGVEISSAQDLINFATAYNAKEYGADLVATVTANITFDATTSADFNATGGIGTPYGGDNYFNGIFNGNNCTISGLEATFPLFGGTGENGVVKNLTLDNSCSFTFTHTDTAEAMFASIVGYHKGVLDNVKVAADIELEEVSDITKMTTVGGLTGRTTVGKLQNGCEYSGLISTPAGFTTTGKLIIGGLVGRFSNAGSITGSYFKGAISNSAQVSSSDKTNPFLIIGGVVGYLDGGGSIISANSTADHADVESAFSGFNGTIVNKTTVAYNSAVGGIVGELNSGTVSSCTNAANIALTIFKPGDGSARYMKTGGIVGKVNTEGTVTGCTNNGQVEHRSNPRLQDIGGIAGYNAGNISSCTNNAVVNHMTTGITGVANKGGRVINIAGVIGENATGAVVTDVHNTADLQISAMESSYDTDNKKPLCEPRMGGVIAYNTANIDGGTSKNITNSGKVYFNTNSQYEFIGYEIGGIVGYSTASVLNAKNTGYVLFNWNSNAYVASKVYLGGVVGMMGGDGTIGGCINEGGASNAGEVYPNLKAGSAGHNNIFAGGILGYSTFDVIISDCVNSGFVHGGNTTRVNGTSFYLGGIVAYLSGASQILDCANTGQVNSAHNNNNDTIGSCALTGGIAGYVEGSEGDPVVIGGTTGCSVDASVVANRGWVAGAVAYAKYVNMSNCTVEQDINCAARGIGGVVGKAEYCTISSSSFNGDKVHANNVQTGTGQGGIVGNLSNSTVDGCSCYATTLTNNVNINTVGTIVGVSGSSNTIQNCHYKATITDNTGSVAANIAGTGSFTDGGDNVADL